MNQTLLSRPRGRRFAVAIAVAAVAQVAAYADDPDDRLPSEQRRLVAGFIQRGMPEPLEELFAGGPTMHRVHIARAYAKAGIDESAPETREKLFTRAAEEYRRVIALSRSAQWLRGERRRFDIAQWRIELADLILRHWITADLDQFEITSGLSYDADRLASRLTEAREQYSLAGNVLEDLDIGLRTEEERFLLLGIAEQIGLLLAQQRINIAWADLYLAMTGPAHSPQRGPLLDEALLAFDMQARRLSDAERMYQAVLGAGITLRELGRYDESVAALERVISSTASASVTIRAEFELAKTLMFARDYEQARRRFEILASRSEDRLRAKDAGAAFYIRVSPLIRAYSFMREAMARDTADPVRAKLEDRARDEFVAVASRGGVWQRMAQLYLDALAGRQRSIEQLSDVELLFAAGQAMSDEKYGDAEKVWRLLLDRPEAARHHAEARFNLGVCLFQLEKVREAAELFLEAARNAPPPSLAERTHTYAYRCWRQLAAESRSPDDYLRLADAALLLSKDFPNHSEAADARWVAALALDEAAESRRAIAAYEGFTPGSPHYWQARWNIARTRQKLFDALDSSAADDRRYAAAEEAATEWLRLADELSALDESTDKSGVSGSADKKNRSRGAPPKDVREAWIVDAKFAACALLASDDLRRFRQALDLLEKLPPGARVLGLQIRCLQSLGEIKEANQVLEEYLARNSADELGSVLVSLAAEMETEVDRMQRAGRSGDARRMALETLPTIRHLLTWIESRPEHSRHVAVVRFRYANMLILAARLDEAMRELESLMSRHPANGAYLIAAARLQEKIADETLASARDEAANRAEALWEKLLKDAKLRDNAPSEYWESRYYWLRHQLRRGKADEVVRGIETERAWHPELGGPPWQGLLLRLADDARAAAEMPTP